MGRQYGLDGRRLPWQQPIQGRDASRLVYTEDELVDAVARAREQSFRTSTIIVGAPIQISSPVILDVAGLALTSQGRQSIQFTKAAAVAFRIKASDVEISRLFIEDPSQFLTDAAIEIDGDSGTLNRIRLTDNRIEHGGYPAVLVKSGSELQHGIFSRNYTAADFGSGKGITGKLTRCVVSGNDVFAALEGVEITDSGSRTAITGNTIRSSTTNAIDTTAGAGNNLIVGNVAQGGVSADAGDTNANNET